MGIFTSYNDHALNYNDIGGSLKHPSLKLSLTALVHWYLY